MVATYGQIGIYLSPLCRVLRRLKFRCRCLMKQTRKMLQKTTCPHQQTRDVNSSLPVSVVQSEWSLSANMSARCQAMALREGQEGRRRRRRRSVYLSKGTARRKTHITKNAGCLFVCQGKEKEKIICEHMKKRHSSCPYSARTRDFEKSCHYLGECERPELPGM